MKFIAIIPARYGSSRFPGKPLAMLGGKAIIQRVYERVKQCFEDVFVATDDQRILDAVEAFGGKAVMTSTNHRSGTDRCWEAYTRCGVKADVVVNVQGDEPFIHPSQLDTIRGCFDQSNIDIATLGKPFTPADGIDALSNPNSPKIVIGQDGNALYFSRSVIPYLRDFPREEWLEHHTFYKHIGLYAYRTDVLERITRMPQGVLERAESLEQLRWLENGLKIRVGMTHAETIGIDTPEDLKRAEAYLLTEHN